MRNSAWRCGVASASVKRVGVDGPQHLDSAASYASRSVALGRIEEVDRAAHDDAAPIEPPLDFVDLERHPRMMLHRRQLRAGRRARVQPAVGEDVRDRLDVHAIVKREREPADVMALEQRDRVVARQLGKGRSFVRASRHLPVQPSRRRALWNREREHASLPELALDPDAPAVRVDDAFRDRQSQAACRERARPPTILPVPVEHSRLVLRARCRRRCRVTENTTLAVARLDGDHDDARRAA